MMNQAKLLLVMAIAIGAGQAVSAEESMSETPEQRKQTQLRIAVQEICPSSGEKLGEHGTPVQVTVGPQKEQVFLCCKACLKQKLDPKHWATIHGNFVKAQQVCPVMKKELPKAPKWTIVTGRIVYVCCPPCIEKIAADPQTYLAKVDALYEASMKDRPVSE
jgi:hypothetical protein